MIKIKAFGSGSSGNGYCLDNGHSQLLLETGISYRKAAPMMDFDFSKVKGILITHEHTDHTKYLAQYLQRLTAPVLMTNGTADALGFDSYRIQRIKPMNEYKLDSWKITAFDVEHDAAEPVGYLIETGSDKLLYVTDTYYVKYRFKDITQMLVEMNYSAEIAAQNVAQGILNQSLEKRIMESHFEMDNSLAFIKANMSDKLQNIVLIHLSSTNGNSILFKQKVQELTGVPVYIAK